MHNELKITDMQTLESNKKTIEESTNPISLDLPDFTTDSYKDAYSRINAIVIEGEQEACLLYTSPSPRDQRGSRMPYHQLIFQRYQKIKI